MVEKSYERILNRIVKALKENGIGIEICRRQGEEILLMNGDFIARKDVGLDGYDIKIDTTEHDRKLFEEM